MLSTSIVFCWVIASLAMQAPPVHSFARVKRNESKTTEDELSPEVGEASSRFYVPEMGMLPPPLGGPAQQPFLGGAFGGGLNAGINPLYQQQTYPLPNYGLGGGVYGQTLTPFGAGGAGGLYPPGQYSPPTSSLYGSGLTPLGPYAPNAPYSPLQGQQNPFYPPNPYNPAGPQPFLPSQSYFPNNPSASYPSNSYNPAGSYPSNPYNPSSSYPASSYPSNVYSPSSSYPTGSYPSSVYSPSSSYPSYPYKPIISPVVSSSSYQPSVPDPFQPPSSSSSSYNQGSTSYKPVVIDTYSPSSSSGGSYAPNLYDSIVVQSANTYKPSSSSSYPSSSSGYGQGSSGYRPLNVKGSIQEIPNDVPIYLPNKPSSYLGSSSRISFPSD